MSGSIKEMETLLSVLERQKDLVETQLITTLGKIVKLETSIAKKKIQEAENAENGKVQDPTLDTAKDQHDAVPTKTTIVAPDNDAKTPKDKKKKNKKKRKAEKARAGTGDSGSAVDDNGIQKFITMFEDEIADRDEKPAQLAGPKFKKQKITAQVTKK